MPVCWTKPMGATYFWSSRGTTAVPDRSGRKKTSRRCAEYDATAHNRQWFAYARQIEAAYGYEILLDSPFNPVGMYGDEAAYRGTCLGCRVEIFGELHLEHIRNQHRRHCSFCGADLEI